MNWLRIWDGRWEGLRRLVFDPCIHSAEIESLIDIVEVGYRSVQLLIPAGPATPVQEMPNQSVNSVWVCLMNWETCARLWSPNPVLRYPTLLWGLQDAHVSYATSG